MSASAAPRITRSTPGSSSARRNNRPQLTLATGGSAGSRTASRSQSRTYRNLDASLGMRRTSRVHHQDSASSQSALVRIGKAVAAARVRAIHVILAIVILVASLFGSLLLRTQMVQDAFSISQTQHTISKLNQDIQEKQVQLERLQASLPNKATDLGMVPGAESVTIDISGAAKTMH